MSQLRECGAPGHGLAPARRAVSLCFFVNGAVIASWVPHIPDLKTWLGIGDGGLGLLLLSMAVGAVVALPSAGWLIGRFGNRVVTSTSAAAFSVAVVLPVLAPGIASCAIALALLGACNATLDVAMNAQGVMVEDGYERRIMSSLHALFSLGGLAGAGGAATAMAAGMSPLVHLVIVALLCLAAVRVTRALAIVCVACALIAAGAGIVPPPRATLATPQTVASEAITRTQEATHA